MSPRPRQRPPVYGLAARWRRMSAVFTARNKEYFRDRAALGWGFLFPVLIVFGFAFAFSGDSRDEYKIGVLNAVGGAAAHPFFALKYLEFVPYDDKAKAIRRVQRHQIDLLIDARTQQYWTNSDSGRGYLAEKLLLGSGAEHGPTGFSRQSVTGKEIRYVDWLLPGMLSMNIMFAALFGVGYVIVRYRKNGVLKRLKGTPLTPVEFLSAQIASRLLIIFVVTAIIYGGCGLVLDFAMFGSLVELFVVFMVGAACLIALGLTVAARVANEELAGGLLNVFTWPMMFLSGVWFSTDGLHPVMQTLARALPLTHVLEASRAIMLDGAGLLDVTENLFALVTMGAVFLVVGSLAFRWE